MRRLTTHIRMGEDCGSGREDSEGGKDMMGMIYG